MDNSYQNIIQHYKEKFESFGDTPQGYDWNNYKDMKRRYNVMLDIIEDENLHNISILDFGCGAGNFCKVVRSIPNYVLYSGIDTNAEAIETARRKFPEESFGVIDIHKKEDWEVFNNPKICRKSYDYIIANGVFTVKGGLSKDQMSEFLCSSLEKLWTKTNKGIAFNLMSKLVDWERDDLFHVSMDQIGRWITDNLSRNFTFKHNYSLYEYTTYIYK